MCFPNNRKRCDPAMVPHDQLSVFFQNTQTLKPLEGAQLCERRDFIQASEPGTTREQVCALFDRRSFYESTSLPLTSLVETSVPLD